MLGLASGASAQGPGTGNVVRAWLEPKSMRAPVTKPISGAQRTEIALGRLTQDGPEYLSKKAFEILGIPFEELLVAAQANAAADLATLKPRYGRDRHKVIQYAELTSTQPIVASAVLAPGFLKMFSETLGEKIFFVVPSRFTVYAFPSLTTRYQEYYPMVWEAYRATAWPVSVEVFELQQDGFRCIGAYEKI